MSLRLSWTHWYAKYRGCNGFEIDVGGLAPVHERTLINIQNLFREKLSVLWNSITYLNWLRKLHWEKICWSKFVAGNTFFDGLAQQTAGLAGQSNGRLGDLPVSFLHWNSKSKFFLKALNCQFNQNFNKPEIQVTNLIKKSKFKSWCSRIQSTSRQSSHYLNFSRSYWFLILWMTERARSFR